MRRLNTLIDILNLAIIYSVFSYSYELPSRFEVGIASHSPCQYTKDNIYGGVYVNCQGLGFTEFPPSEWFPLETTSLQLQHNSISHLKKESLAKITDLRYLCMAFNNLKTIQPKSFQHSAKLKVLDLQGNNIRLDNDLSSWFQELHNLEELILNNNGNSQLYSSSSSYSPKLLSGLYNLRSLTLDTFTGDLDFNGIFNQTKNLTILTITGGMMKIGNETFKDFKDIHLKQLHIINVPNLRNTENGSYRRLNSLDIYSLQNNPQGMTTSLESLGPFVNRNFTFLRFNSIKGNLHKPTTFSRDNIMSRAVSRHLTKMCVKHFVYSDNGLFFIESNTLTSLLWRKCLVSLDLSNNPLLGEIVVYLQFSSMRALKHVKLINQKYSLFATNERIPDSLNCVAKKTHKQERIGEKNIANYKQIHCSQFFKSNETQRMSKAISKKESTEKQISKMHDQQQSLLKLKYKPRVIIFVPKNLVYVNVNGLNRHTLKFSDKFQIQGADNLEELHISDSGLYRMIEPIKGLENIKILDFSKNDGSQLTPAFLSSFPNVITLNMSKMSLNSIFQIPGKNHDLFNNHPYLQSLDLSSNDLYTLPPNIFSQNKRLKYLNLSRNRFKFIPFEFGIRILPKLEILDVQYNSLLLLSGQITEILEEYALMNPYFSLKLNGNVFSCSCSNIKFLQWLQATTLHLDQERIFLCVTQTGEIKSTENFKDIKELWRRCYGEMAFMTSLILLCLMALGFSTVFFCMKFKTQILAVIFQYFNKTFLLKTPDDYLIGVYLGYSDNDADFACLKLRTFIENHLHLTTYLRHMRLLPGSDIADSIITNINSSWRVLFVITESYLLDKWSFLAMKTAMYSVTSSNPGRVVIVLLSDHVRYQIPRPLLNVVKEDSIILLTLQGEQNCLAVGEEEALKKALTLMG